MTTVSPTQPPPFTAQTPKNTPATVALVLGIVSLVLNPLLLTSLAGIIVGIVGAVRGSFGRVKAIVGIALSVVGAIVGIVVMTLILGAIGAAGQAIESAKPAVVPAAPSDDASAAPSASASAGSDGTYAFGQTIAYEDGLQVTVKDAGKFTPSSTGKLLLDKQWKHFERYVITIKNGTGSTFDPSLSTVDLSSADNEGEQVFDSAKGIDSAPSTKIRAGRSVHYDVAFGVSTPKDVTFDLTPEIGRDDVIFTNS